MLERHCSLLKRFHRIRRIPVRHPEPPFDPNTITEQMRIEAKHFVDCLYPRSA